MVVVQAGGGLVLGDQSNGGLLKKVGIIYCKVTNRASFLSRHLHFVNKYDNPSVARANIFIYAGRKEPQLTNLKLFPHFVSLAM